MQGSWIQWVGVLEQLACRIAQACAIGHQRDVSRAPSTDMVPSRPSLYRDKHCCSRTSSKLAKHDLPSLHDLSSINTLSTETCRPYHPVRVPLDLQIQRRHHHPATRANQRFPNLPPTNHRIGQLCPAVLPSKRGQDHHSTVYVGLGLRSCNLSA